MLTFGIDVAAGLNIEISALCIDFILKDTDQINKSTKHKPKRPQDCF
jgi:hypothetical protein